MMSCIFQVVHKCLKVMIIVEESPHVARDGLVKGLPGPFSPIQSSDEAEEQQTKAEGKQAGWLCH